MTLDWTTRVLVATELGIVLVRRPNGLWELPGGKRRKKEESDWQATAIATLRRETGILVDRVTRIGGNHSRNSGKNRYDLIYCRAHACDETVSRMIKATDKRDLRHDGERANIILFDQLARMSLGIEINRVTWDFLHQQGYLRARAA